MTERRTSLTIVSAVLLSATALVGACALQSSSPMLSGEPTTAETPSDRTLTPKDVIGAFGLTEYNSFDEAETVAGYHIPRASDQFQVRNKGIAVRRAKPGRLPNSETLYFYAPTPDVAIRLDVGPDYSWPPGALTHGTAAQYGPWSGWVGRSDDVAREFAFRCGVSAGTDIWCLASSSSQLPSDLFQAFVSGLR